MTRCLAAEWLEYCSRVIFLSLGYMDTKRKVSEDLIDVVPLLLVGKDPDSLQVRTLLEVFNSLCIAWLDIGL